MNVRFVSRSTGVFSRYRICVRLHSRPHLQLTIWVECSHWSMFEFLVRDFPKTSYTGHIARSILSSLPLIILYSCWRKWKCNKTLYCSCLKFSKIPYSGKFTYGANFHIFRMCLLCAKIKTTKIWTFEVFATLKTMREPWPALHAVNWVFDGAT